MKHIRQLRSEGLKVAAAVSARMSPSPLSVGSSSCRTTASHVAIRSFLLTGVAVRELCV